MHNIKGSQLKMLPQSTKHHLKIYVPYIVVSTRYNQNIACYRPTPENHKQHLVIKLKSVCKKSNNLNAHWSIQVSLTFIQRLF